VVLYIYSWRRGHTKKRIPAEIAWWGVAGASLPVVVFVLSMPTAFFVHPVVALVFWSSSFRSACSSTGLRRPERRAYFTPGD
jgi:hypothetical protein